MPVQDYSESQRTKQRKDKTLYANYIINQKAFEEQKRSRVLVVGGSGSSLEESALLDINLGKLYITPAEILQLVPAAPSVKTISFISGSSSDEYGTLTGTISSAGSSAITQAGAVWSTSPNPTTSDNVVLLSPLIQTGTYSVDIYNTRTTYARAFATNTNGTSYGETLETFIDLCLVAGTLIRLASGKSKPIESITYDDTLLVWDFDERVFATAKPLWIKKAERSHQYSKITFSDGTILGSLTAELGHRIFNKERGQFTYPMTDDTPIGTHTFTADAKEVTLTNKELVTEPVDFYNIITNKHINLFANGILTSCRYNNIYPIVDLKFVKPAAAAAHRAATEFTGLPTKYYEGMRHAEQTIPVADTIKYIERLERVQL